MKEIPLLFSAPMVRAVLEGRKTVTRRTRGLDRVNEDLSGNEWRFLYRIGDKCYFSTGPRTPQMVVKSPYGVPGDRLWVKETWRPSHIYADGSINVQYAADGADCRIQSVPADWSRPKAAATGNVSPLFMPRWASRLTLEVVSVRPERLHEISEDDADREGIVVSPPHTGIGFDGSPIESSTIDWAPSDYFRKIWEEINGAGSWTKNPWVWRVEFKVVAE